MALRAARSSGSTPPQLRQRCSMSSAAVILLYLVERLVDNVSDEFCHPPFAGKVGGVVVEEEFVRCLHPIALDERHIILDVFVVSIRACGDGEGGTPRCRAGVSGLDEADKVVRAVIVVVELVEERFHFKDNCGDVIVRRLTGDANKVIRRECEDSSDFVRRHCGGGTSVGGMS